MRNLRLPALSAAAVAALTTAALPLSSAEAYVGPGVSAGAIAVVLGILGSVFLALFAIVWYPLKRLMKKGRPVEKTAETGDPNS